MKKSKNMLMRYLLLVLPFWFLSCDKSTEPSIEDRVTTLLSTGTWSPTAAGSSITLSGTDVVNDLFPGFTLRFTRDRIFTTGTTPIWLREDTWYFQNKEANLILRGMDNRENDIHEISDSQLILSLEWDQTTFGGKVMSLPGRDEFTLTK